MALHFTRVGEDELSIHFDIDGLGKLLKAIEGAIAAARDHRHSGAPDGVAVTGSGGPPGALGKVTVTFLDPPPPFVTH
jgi:hypothetical protein